MKKRVLGLTMAMVTAISMTGCGGGGTTATTAAAKEYRYDKLDSGKKDPFAVFGHGSGHCAGALRHRPQSGQQGALHDLTVSGHAMCDHLVVSGGVSA